MSDNTADYEGRMRPTNIIAISQPHTEFVMSEASEWIPITEERAFRLPSGSNERYEVQGVFSPRRQITVVREGASREQMEIFLFRRGGLSFKFWADRQKGAECSNDHYVVYLHSFSKADDIAKAKTVAHDIESALMRIKPMRINANKDIIKKVLFDIGNPQQSKLVTAEEIV